MGMIDPKKPEMGEMPLWDLADLYPSRDSAELKRDLKDSAVNAAAFKAQYQGKLAGLSGAGLGAAIAAYEQIDETLTRIMTFGYLTYALAVDDAALTKYQPWLRDLRVMPWAEAEKMVRDAYRGFSPELEKLDG